MSTSPRAVPREAPTFGFVASLLLLIQTAAPQANAAPPAASSPAVPTAPPPTVLPPPPAAPLPEAASRRHLRYAEREAI